MKIEEKTTKALETWLTDQYGIACSYFRIVVLTEKDKEKQNSLKDRLERIVREEYEPVMAEYVKRNDINQKSLIKIKSFRSELFKMIQEYE